MPAVPQFLGDSVLRIGDLDFHDEWPLNHVPPGHLGIEKSRPLLEAYFALWAELQPARVLELGIRRGGSTALLSELGGAERIVSVELSETRLEALDDYVAARGAQDVVHPHYGVNQADRERLLRIVEDGSDWAAVRRGPAALDARSFRLDDHAPDHLQLLVPPR